MKAFYKIGLQVKNDHGLATDDVQLPYTPPPSGKYPEDFLGSNILRNCETCV